MTTMSQSQVHLPRVEIKFCVKCKWNLRAAYYAQELLQTFCSPPSDITLGEIALVPTEGGIFTVTLYHATPAAIPSIASPESATPASTHVKSTNPQNERKRSLQLVGQGPTPILESVMVTDPIPITASTPEATSTPNPGRKGSLSFAGNGPTPTLAPLPDPVVTTTPSPLPSTINATTDTDPTNNNTTTIPQATTTATVKVTATQIWDRKADGGFPETKELKNRIRNLVDPARRMGHIDRSLEKGRKDDGVGGGTKPENGSKAKAKAGDGDGGVDVDVSRDEVVNTDTSVTATRDGDASVNNATETSNMNSMLMSAGDCEDCRLEAMESLEDEIGRINSR